MRGARQLLLVALGGNSLVEGSEDATIHEQLQNAEATARQLVNIFRGEYDVVLTHGNGPQVGNLLIQQEEASSKVPPMPLDVCVAGTQGELGYILQQTFLNVLHEHGIKRDITVVPTRVLVDRKDPAFERPSKPVGPYFDTKRARNLMRTRKWVMAADPSGKGYRRLVPSPRPLRILEARVIHQLVLMNNIPIAAGGGGIPVYVNSTGSYVGLEAVIDKDLASAQLAIDLKADKLIILTNVPCCYLNYRMKNQIAIEEMNLDEAQTYLDQGHFSEGSMGPKVRASIDYLSNGGKEAIICNIRNGFKALQGKSGTRIHH